MPHPHGHFVPLPLAPAGSLGEPDHSPRIALQQFDNLWFQLAGTLCNLACTHCFISCSPTNHSFGFLKFGDVIAALNESRRLGVKEYYFTGGEPFMHPRILEILQETLKIGPATVLTNGTLFRDETVRRLAELRDGSMYSLELRVSIDAPTAEANDSIRGAGSFARAMAGVKKLVDARFLPIVTMAQTWGDGEGEAVFDQMRRTLKALGYMRPRVKMLPALRIGAEAARTRGYRDDERVTPEMMEGFDASTLLCSNSRIVSDRGVHVCPILIDRPDSLLGRTLNEAAKRDYALRHQACYTCWQYGAICSNASSVAGQKEIPAE